MDTSPVSTTDTNDSNRRASDTNGDISADTEQAQKDCYKTGRRSGRLGAIAALQRTSAAGILPLEIIRSDYYKLTTAQSTNSLNCSWRGDRKKRKSGKSSDGSEFYVDRLVEVLEH